MIGKLRASTLRRPIVTIALVALVGLLKVAEPLGGDQSLFLVGAHELHDGASLYRDFWDLKQPAIYIFYFLATSLRSYSAIAIHIFELFYLTLFSVVLIVALRRSRSFGTVADWVPLGAVAFYYLAAGSFEAIQVESLVAFPLFLTLFFLEAGFRAERRQRRLGFFFASGVATAVVLAFKIIFLPIVVALWTAAIVACLPRQRSSIAFFTKAFLAAATGCALACLLVVAFFARAGTLEIALQTWFALPPRIVKEIPHESISSLLASIRWFVHRFAGMIVLAVVGTISVARHKPDAFALGAIAWLASGVFVILIQVTSWFQYQWLLLAAPLGMLATLGVQALYAYARSVRTPFFWRIVASLAIAVAAIALPAQMLLKDIVPLAKNGLAVTPESRERYRDSVAPVYKALRADARYAIGTGDVYVIGDPTFYVVSKRLQPIQLNGSSVRLFLPEQWALLERELATARPTYIYRSHGVEIASRVATELSANYRLVHRGVLGNLYTIKAHSVDH